MIKAEINGMSLGIYQTHYDINSDAKLITAHVGEDVITLTVEEAEKLASELSACVNSFDR